MSSRSKRRAICLLTIAAVAFLVYRPARSFVVMRFVVPHRYASEVASARANGADVLLLGDSLTAGWRRHPDLLTGIGRIANYGFNGDRPSDLERRIRGGDLTGISPAVVVVMIGTNAAGKHEAADTVSSVRRIAGEVQKFYPACHLILVGVPPRNVGETSEVTWVSEVNAGLAGLASSLGVPFVDPSPMAGPNGGLKPELTTDGLHFTRAGYEALSRLLLPEIIRVRQVR